MYSLKNISTKYKIDLDDLIKVGLCLGTDFNKKGVKDTFFPDENVEINFLCNLGYGDADSLFARSLKFW